jgi:hypothetical protein
MRTPSKSTRFALTMIGLLVLSLGVPACTTPPAPSDPPVVLPPPPSAPAEIAASIADVAVAAALEEATRTTPPPPTRQSIVDAGLAAATNQALLIAPGLIADPMWAPAIRTAITLAVVLSKSDAESRFVVNEQTAKTKCEQACLKSLGR